VAQHRVSVHAAGFEDLTAAVMKSTIFWDGNLLATLVSCSAYFFDPEDGGDKSLRNVG
jgi:hypothetical protein